MISTAALTRRYGTVTAVSELTVDIPAGITGLIGANGAGKSTTLKILNRVLRPTRGRFEVRGRAGALIEVSAGFHSDLTGRENVYLQGAIMGMRRHDIVRRFDDIVAFAGVEEFIDTPVKRYSSGMNARLGFSIAAHLDPEVLIIDEVLAVGDLSFQNRAFGRIEKMVRSGIPVVIVSHQLDRMATLCTHAIVLERGQVIRTGTPSECIEHYVQAVTARPPSKPDEQPILLHSVEVISDLPASSGSDCRLRIRGWVRDSAGQRYDPFHLRVRSAANGHVVFTMNGRHLGIPCPPPGDFVADLDLQLNVPPGVYAVETATYNTVEDFEQTWGPVTYVQVAGGAPFQGDVQLNPRVRIHETR